MHFRPQTFQRGASAALIGTAMQALAGMQACTPTGLSGLGRPRQASVTAASITPSLRIHRTHATAPRPAAARPAFGASSPDGPLRNVSAAAGKVKQRAVTRVIKEKTPAKRSSSDPDESYPNWLALPLQPGNKRNTKMYETIKGQVWMFEQRYGVLDVVVNIRMVVVRMADGGLLVFCPVAPTRELRNMLDEIGEVKFVVLPTTAVEHKVFLGPFASKYPDAEVYAAPGQWSFPLNLPLSFLGLGFRRVNGYLSNETKGELPFADEFDLAVLNTPLGLGPFCEVAMYHKKTRTLLVVDTVIQVPTEPPEVCAERPAPLLNRAKDFKDDVVEYNRAGLRRGWGKTALFALFFQPESVDFSPISGFTWSEVWKDSVSRLVKPKLFVAPILQALVLNKRPRQVMDWVDTVCSWPFSRIIPAHFVAPIDAGPADFRAAFDFLGPVAKERAGPGGAVAGLLGRGRSSIANLRDGDMRVLRAINGLLVASGTIKEEKDSVKAP